MAGYDKIQIGIQKSLNNEATPTDNGMPNVDSKDKEKLSFDKQAIATAAIDQGKQMALQGVTLYGEMTGDMTTVKKINFGLSLSADVLTIVKGGVVGAIAVAGKYTIQGITSAVQTTNANRQIALNNQTLGYISKQGSRYY